MKARHENTQFLDGLRGLAALSVVFSHLALWYFPEAHSGIGPTMTSASATALWLYHSPVSFFYKGGYAVSVFFVLSGFVLATICMKKRAESIYLAKATAKRYIRLGGPVAASIFLCIILKSLGLFHNTDLGISVPLSNAYDSGADWWAAIKSAVYGAMLYGDRSFNYVLWTISIEFYGSLLVFSLVGIFGVSNLVFRRAALLLSLVFFVQAGQLVNYSMFFFGAWLSTFRFKPPHSHNGLAITAIIGGLYLGGYAPTSDSYSLLVKLANTLQANGIKLNWPAVHACLGAVLLIYGTLALKSIHSILSSSALSWMGAISFSLYLTHSFVLTAIAGPVMHAFGDGTVSFAVSTTLVVVTSLICAHIFWKLFDSPSIRAADRFAELFVSQRTSSERQHKGWGKSELELERHSKPPEGS